MNSIRSGDVIRATLTTPQPAPVVQTFLYRTGDILVTSGRRDGMRTSSSIPLSTIARLEVGRRVEPTSIRLIIGPAVGAFTIAPAGAALGWIVAPPGRGEGPQGLGVLFGAAAGMAVGAGLGSWYVTRERIEWRRVRLP